MSIWDVRFESAEHFFDNALVRLYKINDGSKPMPTHSVVHSHGYYELHLVTKGEYTYTIDGKNLCVRAGELTVIKPDTLHKSVVFSEDIEVSVLGLTVHKISDDSDFCKTLTEKLDETLCTALMLPTRLADKIVDYCMRPVADTVADYCKNKLTACEIAVGLITLICDNDTFYRSSACVDFDIMLETFISMPSVTLKQMAQRLNYSERHLARMIKSRYGMSLTDLRRNIYEKNTP